MFTLVPSESCTRAPWPGLMFFAPIAVINARALYFGHRSLFLDYVDLVDDNDDGYSIFAKPKPETAHVKCLAPKVESSKIKR